MEQNTRFDYLHDVINKIQKGGEFMGNKTIITKLICLLVLNGVKFLVKRKDNAVETSTLDYLIQLFSQEV